MCTQVHDSLSFFFVAVNIKIEANNLHLTSELPNNKPPWNEKDNNATNNVSCLSWNRVSHRIKIVKPAVVSQWNAVWMANRNDYVRFRTLSKRPIYRYVLTGI